jgi:hypothetical protein
MPPLQHSSVPAAGFLQFVYNSRTQLEEIRRDAFRECVENDDDLAELEEQWCQVSQAANIFNHPKCNLVTQE